MSLFSYCLSRENTRSRRWRNAALLRRKSSRVESNQPQIRLLQSSKLSSGFLLRSWSLSYTHIAYQLISNYHLISLLVLVHWVFIIVLLFCSMFQRFSKEWRMDLLVLIVFIERRILSFSIQLEPSCEPTYAHWSAMKHAAGTSPLKRDEIAGGVRKFQIR